jgi:hypothetical protein
MLSRGTMQRNSGILAASFVCAILNQEFVTAGHGAAVHWINT